MLSKKGDGATHRDEGNPDSKLIDSIIITNLER